MTEKKKILLAEIDYRQWLIGQAVAGLAANANFSATDIALEAIDTADAVLDALEEKQGVVPAARIVEFQKSDEVQCSSCSRKYDVSNGPCDQWKLWYLSDTDTYVWKHKHESENWWHDATEVKQ